MNDIHIVCPHCSATDVRRSRRRGVEYVLALIGFYPHRCRACMRRFVSRTRDRGALVVVTRGETK